LNLNAGKSKAVFDWLQFGEISNSVGSITAGNRTRAAQELGISRATLINKIKSYGLDL